MNPDSIPRWEDMLAKLDDPHLEEELKLLRQFYSTWLNYHTIPKHHKDLQQKAGAALIEIHEELQRWINENRH
jgi:hypothetical protein